MKGLCWDCGADAELINHHPIPQSKGGKNTIPICHECHEKAHDVSLPRLIADGIGKRRAAGGSHGGLRPIGLGRGFEDAGLLNLVHSLHAGGLSIRAIADELTTAGMHGRNVKFHATQVARILRRAPEAS